MGGGLSGEDAGRGWRFLLFGLPEKPPLREQRAAGPRRSPGGLAENDRCDRRSSGCAGGSRFLAADEGTISRGGGELFAESADGLGVPHERDCEIWEAWLLPENHALRQRVRAR